MRLVIVLSFLTLSFVIDANNRQPLYKLNYFDLRGRAEQIRLIAAAASIPYEDVRISEDDWFSNKSLKQEAPLGQVPYIEIRAPSLGDNYKLPQSIAIARYFARMGNLDGRNLIEQAQADAIVDTILELNTAYNSVTFCPNCTKEERQRGIDNFLSTRLAKYMRNIEILIRMYGKNGYSSGELLTWADLVLYAATDSTTIRNSTKEFDEYTLIKRVRVKVEANARVARYLKRRPDGN